LSIEVCGDEEQVLFILILKRLRALKIILEIILMLWRNLDEEVEDNVHKDAAGIRLKEFVEFNR
jgi:hypothetical protein